MSESKLIYNANQERLSLSSFSVSPTWRRGVAKVLDNAINLSFTLVMIPLFSDSALKVVNGSSEFHILTSWADLATMIVCLFAYNAFCLARWGGTPGKLLLGLRIVEAKDFENARSVCVGIPWYRALLRQLVSFIISFDVYFNLAVCMFRKDRRQLADLVAGTQVVHNKERKDQVVSRKYFAAFLVLVGILTLISNFKIYSRILEAANIQFTNEGITLVLESESNSN